MGYKKNLKIDDFEEKIFALSKEILTNFFPTPKLLEKISNTKTHLIYDDKTWILVVKDNDFWKMYFSFNKDSAETDILSIKKEFDQLLASIEKLDVVCEYLSKFSQNEQIDLFLKDLTFAFFVKRERLRLSQSDIKLSGCDYSNYLIEKAGEDFAAEILSLYDGTFDKYTSCIPTKEELIDSIQAGHILLLKNLEDQNEFLALLEYCDTCKNTSISHFIVKPDYRGHGLANVLLNEYLSEVVIRDNKRAHLWVQVENEPAKQLYAKHGYKEEHLYSVAYLIDRRTQC